MNKTPSSASREFDETMLSAGIERLAKRKPQKPLSDFELRKASGRASDFELKRASNLERARKGRKRAFSRKKASAWHLRPGVLFRAPAAKASKVWDKNKRVFVVAALSGLFGFFMYGAWKNAQNKREAAAARHGAPHRAGLLAPMTEGMLGGWYERDLDLEAENARQAIESMYPHFEAPETPVVTKGYFAGMPRPLYRASHWNLG
jgi:hypothetical protein